MATKNIWQPGMKSVKTPKGIETAVPKEMDGKELSAHLAELDSVLETDPEAAASYERSERRAARWNRQQAPIRAWVKFYAELPDDDNKPHPSSEEYDALYKQFIKEYRVGTEHKFSGLSTRQEPPQTPQRQMKHDDAAKHVQMARASKKMRN